MNSRCQCGNKTLLGRDVCWRCDKNARNAKRINAERRTGGIMKTGTTNTYITARMAALLDAHGPQGDLLRPLSAKLGYIVPAWDAVMRDEAERWRKKLEPYEMKFLQEQCGDLVRSIDGGASAADVVNAILDSMARAGVGNWTMAQRIRGQIQRATVAARAALVWMLRDVANS